MSDQRDMFGTRTDRWGRAEAVAAREHALHAVEDHADPVWFDEAVAKLRIVAEQMRELTSDDLWSLIKPPHEPRAVGAVFRKAKTLGWIEPTDRTRQSLRPDCHARPLRIWESLL